MNRKEVIKRLNKIIDYYYIEMVENEHDDEIDNIMEVLESPLTLADFLGWEEDVAYRRGGSYFKIEGNHLLHKGHSGKWVNMNLQTWELIDLRQATKVEPKLKAYHVKDEYSFNELMKELEEQGKMTIIGNKPTEAHFRDSYKRFSIICDDEDGVRFSTLDFFEKFNKDNYDLIKYHKEEPKFYAKIKGWELIDDGDSYWHKDENPIYGIYPCWDRYDASIYTKTEWKKLGINDTNADFEEIEGLDAN